MTAITDAVRVSGKKKFRLSDVAPDATPGFKGDKQKGQRDLAKGGQKVAELQERLFAASRADGTRRVLLILQGMDTSGKGGILRHVIGEVDPQGVAITSFKAPTRAEKRHDFLWRIERAVPEAGLIGVFDRSQYEDVLIHRVRELSTPDEIERRYGAINDFEQGLVDEGVVVVKVMLHISRDEQGARLLVRLEREDKHWKFNPGDIDERELWDAYQEAYEVAIRRTSTKAAPWHVVPADRKWFARLAVHQLLLEALESIDPQWPRAEFDPEDQKQRLLASGVADDS